MKACLKQRFALAALAVVLVLVAAPAFASEVLVYAQNPDFLALYASQNDTAGFGNFATTYDNFTLGRPQRSTLWSGLAATITHSRRVRSRRGQ